MTSTNIQLTDVSSVSKWFNLNTILNATTNGKEILTYYEANGKLLPQHRKKLKNLILDKTFSIKKQLSIPERQEIAQQISLVFHNEDSVGYSFYFDVSNFEWGKQ